MNLLDKNNNFAKSKIYYNIANLYLEQKNMIKLLITILKH